MTKLLAFLERNANAVFVSVVSGVIITAVSSVMIWVCLTTNENAKDIAVLEEIVK